MIIIAEYGSQDVVCPFYHSETNRALSCEGVINKICMQHFVSNRQKQEHKDKYCNTFNYKNCLYAKGLLDMYKPRAKETAGTFAEDTLLKYRQK